MLLGLLLLLPLLGAAFNGFGSAVATRRGTPFPVKAVNIVGVGVMALSAVLAWVLFAQLMGQEPHHRAFEQLLFEWIHVGSGPGSLNIDFALWLDPLSMVMVLIITNVGALIHLYSTGYMKGDPGYARFFAYLNLFIFSMLCLVLGENLLRVLSAVEDVARSLQSVDPAGPIALPPPPQ